MFYDHQWPTLFQRALDYGFVYSMLRTIHSWSDIANKSHGLDLGFGPKVHVGYQVMLNMAQYTEWFFVLFSLICMVGW